MRQGAHPGRFCLRVDHDDPLGNKCERCMLAYIEVLANATLELRAPGIRVVLGIQAARAHPELD